MQTPSITGLNRPANIPIATVSEDRSNNNVRIRPEVDPRQAEIAVYSEPIICEAQIDPHPNPNENITSAKPLNSVTAIRIPDVWEGESIKNIHAKQKIACLIIGTVLGALWGANIIPDVIANYECSTLDNIQTGTTAHECPALNTIDASQGAIIGGILFLFIVLIGTSNF